LANDKLAKSYLIMEDDVVLFDRWILRWMTAAKHIPADADVIYLGGILPPNKESFASVAEGVNDYFGRVAPNTLFSSHPRRYFHFCNYAYVLTQQGARKLITLVKEKGIFTSGDHMIVNHGDNLLNIYFTLPLLATCYQENDPIYQKSDFNNFNRVDNFDSDLWNNMEAFSPEELMAAVSPSAPASASDPVVAKPILNIVVPEEFRGEVAERVGPPRSLLLSSFSQPT
jgi:GR25 family glycosyltransferase involved in LPS biosynthesis